MADYSKYSETELLAIAKEYEKRFNCLWDYIRGVEKHYFITDYPEAKEWFDLFDNLTPPI